MRLEQTYAESEVHEAWESVYRDRDHALRLAAHGFETIGIDISAHVLEQARTTAERLGLAEDVRFMQGGLEELALPDESVAGIHCRPSTLIVERMRGYEGDLCVRRDGQESDLRSVLGLMALGLTEGERVEIRVAGRDEERTCEALVALFERRFDFPPRQSTAAPAAR